MNIFDIFSKIQTIEFLISLYIKLFYLQLNLTFILHVLILN